MSAGIFGIRRPNQSRTCEMMISMAMPLVKPTTIDTGT